MNSAELFLLELGRCIPKNLNLCKKIQESTLGNYNDDFSRIDEELGFQIQGANEQEKAVARREAIIALIIDKLKGYKDQYDSYLTDYYGFFHALAILQVDKNDPSIPVERFKMESQYYVLYSLWLIDDGSKEALAKIRTIINAVKGVVNVHKKEEEISSQRYAHERKKFESQRKTLEERDRAVITDNLLGDLMMLKRRRFLGL